MINYEDIIGLGLESSCDETAAAIVKNGKQILSNTIFSQIRLHKEYFGVVPEIASRAHLEVINDLIDKAMQEAGVDFKRLNYVAVTNKPGLTGSLLIALQSAKTLAYTLDIPLIGINHLEAHLYAPFLEGHELKFPYIGLLISGGNTAVFEVKGIDDMEVLAKTTDDAVGEAFDKVAKYLDLSYPGGPVIEKLAKKAVHKKSLFPKILPDPEDERFSYSGLKTAVVNFVKKNTNIDKAEIVYSFQESALELLVRKVFSLSRKKNIVDIVIAGGVASNGRLREMLNSAKRNENLIIPSPALCTDNAAMVGGLGYQYYIQNKFDDMMLEVKAKA